MNYFQIALTSFVSLRPYRHVYRHWRGVGYMYLLLLVIALTALSVSLSTLRGYDMLFAPRAEQEGQSLLQYATAQLSQQIPVMHLKDGRLSLDEPSDAPIPLYLNDGEGEILFAYIDMTGDRTLLDDEAVALISAEEIIGRKSSGGYESYTYADIESELASFSPPNAEGEMRVDGALFSNMMDALQSWATQNKIQILLLITFCGSIALGIFWFVVRIFTSMILALIMKLWGAWLSVRIPFDVGIRLAVVAMTPALLLQAVISNIARDPFMGGILPGAGVGGWVFLALLLMYSFIAVKAVQSEEAELAEHTAKMES